MEINVTALELFPAEAESLAKCSDTCNGKTCGYSCSLTCFITS